MPTFCALCAEQVQIPTWEGVFGYYPLCTHILMISKDLSLFFPISPTRGNRTLSRSPALNLSLSAVALPLRWDVSMVEPPGTQGSAPVSIRVLGQGALPRGC